MHKRLIYPIDHHRLPRNCGEKIKNLQYLFRKGYSIPPTHAISWDLQRVYHQNGEQFPDFFCHDLERVLDLNKSYAVRSSANVEDAQSLSYAGQFQSVLEVRGLDNVLDAIRAVWASSHLEAPRKYQSHKRAEQVTVKMGLVFQEMIPARFSGAPDVWNSARFRSNFLASSFSCSRALSTPVHTQVTQAVETVEKV